MVQVGRDEKGIEDYNAILELKKTGKNMTQIAKETNLHISQVSRMLKKDFTPFKTSARYFGDLIKDKDWFYGI